MRTISSPLRSGGEDDGYRSREYNGEVIEGTILDPRGDGDW
jgi:hypothetical protein